MTTGIASQAKLTELESEVSANGVGAQVPIYEDYNETELQLEFNKGGWWGGITNTQDRIIESLDHSLL